MTQPDDLSRLDDVDRRLIRLLMDDGRLSYAALAPEVGLSQAATRVRVQRLLDDRVIDVNARVDPSVLGYGVFTFAVVSVRGPVGPIADRITEIPEAVFVVQTSGRWELLVEIRAVDNSALVRVLDRLRGVEEVTDLETMTVLRYAKQDWSTVGGIGASAPAAASRPEAEAAHTVDEVDIKLIHGLVANGRASFTELAQLVELSQASVRDRVLRLLRGILTVQATPGPGATDHLVWAAILLKVSGEAEKVSELLASRQELTLVAVSAGRFGVICEAWANDVPHLIELTEWIRKVVGIGATETLHYNRIVKQEFGGGAV